VTLVLDWPLLAAFAFWEEVLPLTDVLPSATVGWLLVLLGARPWIRARRGLPPRDELPAPPLADLQAYRPPEAYLTRGTKPWEE
jgi:hypothetical protein